MMAESFFIPKSEQQVQSGLVSQRKEEEKSKTLQEVAGATMRETISGWRAVDDALMSQSTELNPLRGIFSPIVKEEGFSLTSQKAKDLFDKYDIAGVTYINKEYLDRVSSFDGLESAIVRTKQMDADMEAINSMGNWKYPVMLGASMLDPIGGGAAFAVGKAAYKGATLLGVAERSVTAGGIAGVGGAIGGQGAYDALAPTGSTMTEFAINSAIGFGIGTTVGRGAFASTIDPNKKTGIAGLQDNIVNEAHAETVVGAKPQFAKQNYWMNWLHSGADRMKTSNNSVIREVGYKFSRSMGGSGAQKQTTVLDVKDEYGAGLNETMLGLRDEKVNFANTVGREFDDTDNATVTKQFHSIDHQYNQAKLQTEKLLEDEIIAQRKKEVLTAIDNDPEAVKVRNEVAARVEEARKTQENILQEKLQKAGVSEDIAELETRQINLQKELEAVKAKDRSQMDAETLKAEKTLQKSLTMKLNALNKKLDNQADYIAKREGTIDKYQRSLEKEAQKIAKEYEDTIFKDVSATPEEKAMFRKQAIDSNQEKLQQLLDDVPAEYKPFVTKIRELVSKYGNEINKHELDGIKDLDTSFHAPRSYNIKAIAQDPEAAVAAFYKAIAKNFTSVDEKLSKQIQAMANSIVTKLVIANNHRDAVSVPREILNKAKVDSIGQSGKLKNRTLRLDAGELGDFMESDLGTMLTNYSRDISSRLALKRTFDIDSQRTPAQFAMENNIVGSDQKSFNDAIASSLERSMMSNDGGSTLSRVLGAVRKVNFINFGGFFGVNTTADIANVVNDFGFARTAKYVSQDIVSSLSKNDPATRKLSRMLGNAAHSVMNDRALNAVNNAGEVAISTGERMLDSASTYMAKYNGMNYVIDTMERVAGMAGMDFILTAKIDKFFVKNANRLGLSMDDVSALRKAGIAQFDEVGAIKDIDYSKLDDGLKYNLERALRRAVDDTVIKGHEMDLPPWFKSLGSPDIAATLFQFLRMPIAMHNKIGLKMLDNPNMVNVVASAATGITILAMVSQLKDLGKEKPRFDLSTDEGQANFTKMIIEYTPALGSTAMLQMNMDVIGRMIAGMQDKEYKARTGDELNMGVTLERLQSTHSSIRDIIDGRGNGRDVSELARWGSTNLYFINPFVNAFHDNLKDMEFKND